MKQKKPGSVKRLLPYIEVLERVYSRSGIQAAGGDL